MIRNMDVAVVMGSKSDYDIMQHSELILKNLDVSYDTFIVSAHRTPDRLYTFAKGLHSSSFKIVIAGASGAAHLPGMIASLTCLPVLGVPVSSPLIGLDSLFSIVQMPSGVPVATFSIGKPGAINAALFAARILSLSDDALSIRLQNWHNHQSDAVPDKV